MATEIPDYAMAWGNVRQADASEMPDNFDDRILLESIFVLTANDGKSQLVVSESCDHCKERRQGCSRGYPACDRCETQGRRCLYSRGGWKPLPKSKQKKGKSRVDIPLHSENTKDIFLPSEESPRKRTAARIATSLISSQYQPLDLEETQTIQNVSSTSSPKKRGRKAQIPLTPKSIPKKQDGRKKKRKRGDQCDDEDLDDLLCLREKRVKIEKRKNKPTWSVAKPDAASRMPQRDRISLDANPGIWCESRSDLNSAIPELGHLLNNVCIFDSDSPVLFLDGNAWNDDIWNGGTEIEFSLGRRFTCLETYQPEFWTNLDKNDLIKITDKDNPDESQKEPAKYVESLNKKSIGRPESSVSEELNSGVSSETSEKTRSSTTWCNPFKALGRIPKKKPQQPVSSEITENTDKPVSEFGSIASSATDAIQQNPSANDLMIIEEDVQTRAEPQSGITVHPTETLLKENSDINNGNKGGNMEVDEIDNSKEMPEKTSDPTTSAPKHIDQFPDDIRWLYEAVKCGIPISLIASSSWSLLPFSLRKDMKIFFLGFFHISDIQVSLNSVKIVERKGVKKNCGIIRWRIRLTWIGGGIPGMKPPSEPWWSTPGVDNVYLSSGSFKSPEEVGITLLPQYLYAFDNQWWHCNHCGKLNLTGWMGKRECTCSPPDIPTPLVDEFYLIAPTRVLEAEFVRDCLRCIPNFVPNVEVSKDITELIQSWPNGMRTFTYGFKNPKVLKEEDSDAENLKVLKYVYTCNLPELEEECDEFFRRFQEEVALKLKPNQDKADLGAQYTYNVVPDDYTEELLSDGVHTWEKAAPILQEIRHFMHTFACDYARPKASFHLFPFCDVVSWRYCKAKEWETIETYSSTQPVMLLCLGADMELQIENVTHRGYINSLDPQDMAVEDEGVTDDEELVYPEIETRTHKITLDIPLSHGSMVFISGCKLRYRVSAKEFSILMKGYHRRDQVERAQ